MIDINHYRVRLAIRITIKVSGEPSAPNGAYANVELRILKSQLYIASRLTLYELELSIQKGEIPFSRYAYLYTYLLESVIAI